MLLFYCVSGPSAQLAVAVAAAAAAIAVVVAVVAVAASASASSVQLAVVVVAAAASAAVVVVAVVTAAASATFALDTIETAAEIQQKLHSPRVHVPVPPAPPPARESPEVPLATLRVKLDGKTVQHGSIRKKYD